MSYPPYQPRLLPNGKVNPKYVDLTKEIDPDLLNQNYTVMSFITPGKILKDKNLFMFQAFVKRWEFSKKMQGYSQFNNFISYKYNLNADDIKNDFADFLREEGQKLKSDVAVEDDYKNFIEKHTEKLEKEFDTKHKFRTSVNSFKNSGNFNTEDEASAYAKEINALYPGHTVGVGKVGQWGIWDPENEKRGDVQYANEELNQLVHEKNKNEAIAKTAFDTRVREAKETAIADNIVKAEKSGNVLTQNIDENGELFGSTTQDNELREMGPNVTEDDVRNVLFEGENVVMDKNTDKGQSQLLSGPLASKKNE